MIKYADTNFSSIDKIKLIVRECEDLFDKQLVALSDKVYCEKDLKVITLSGPTCSGKTTASKKLVEYFSDKSKRVNIISIDDFYFDKEKLHEISRKKGMDTVDYDSVDTIDLSLLKSVVDEIFDKKQTKVHTPVFDFTKGKRVGFRELDCTENDIFLFEGIQVLYPEVHSLFDAHFSCDIFICVDSSISVNGVLFSPNEIRLMRRLVRDHNFRATDAATTFRLWENVRQNEDNNILPYASVCRYRLDSTFSCEISLLKDCLFEILQDFEKDNTYYNLARNIVSKIEGIPAINSKYLAEDSLYCEFLQ